MIIRARERKEEKPICSSRLSRSCSTLSHELMSRVWPVRRLFLTESIVVSVSIREIRTQSLKRQSTDSTKSVVGEPTTTTIVRAMNKNQTLLEINAAIAAMLGSNLSYLSVPSYMKEFFADGIIRCLLYDDFL